MSRKNPIITELERDLDRLGAEKVDVERRIAHTKEMLARFRPLVRRKNVPKTARFDGLAGSGPPVSSQLTTTSPKP